MQRRGERDHAYSHPATRQGREGSAAGERQVIARSAEISRSVVHYASVVRTPSNTHTHSIYAHAQ